MDPTPRFWSMAGVGALSAVLGAVFARPVLVAGAAGVGAVVLARQYAFVRRLRALDEELTVRVATDAQFVRHDGATEVTLTVSVPSGAPLPLAVTVDLPVIAGSVAESDRTVTLQPGATDRATTFEVEWPVVGQATIPRPTVSVADASGTFRERYRRGPETEVRVEPRRPRNVHVGEGGDAVSAPFGGHRAEQYGQGTDPAEVRRYTAGDSISDIDWKATARLAYPHVREYEVETDRRTVLLVDHRPGLAEGPAGETKFDHLREVALTVASAAEDATDPLGLYAVGEAGLTAEFRPSTAADRYRDVQARLHALAPVSGGRPTTAARQTAAAPERSARVLADDDSAYGRTLAPYFDEREGYVSRMDDDPLFRTVRTHVDTLGGDQWLLLFTDDSNRARLRETVKLATSNGNNVVCFLAPSVLYGGDALADLDGAYDQYVDFESFRRELTRLDRVAAYEVAPRDRLSALLDTD